MSNSSRRDLTACETPPVEANMESEALSPSPLARSATMEATVAAMRPGF